MHSFIHSSMMALSSSYLLYFLSLLFTQSPSYRTNRSATFNTYPGDCHHNSEATMSLALSTQITRKGGGKHVGAAGRKTAARDVWLRRPTRLGRAGFYHPLAPPPSHAPSLGSCPPTILFSQVAHPQYCSLQQWFPSQS